jgi:hypothetical protein
MARRLHLFQRSQTVVAIEYYAEQSGPWPPHLSM